MVILDLGKPIDYNLVSKVVAQLMITCKLAMNLWLVKNCLSEFLTAKDASYRKKWWFKWRRNNFIFEKCKESIQDLKS